MPPGKNTKASSTSKQGTKTSGPEVTPENTPENTPGITPELSAPRGSSVTTSTSTSRSSAESSSRTTRSSQNAISLMHSCNGMPVSALSQGLRSVRESVSSAELADKDASAGPALHRCCECVYKFKSRTAWVKCVRCPEPSGWAHSLCAGFKSEAEAKRSDWVCGDCRSTAATSLTAAFASSPVALVNRHQGFLSSPDAFLSRSSISRLRLCLLSRQQGMTRGMAAYIKKEFDKKHSLMALFHQPEPKEPNSRSTRPTQSFRLQVLPDQLQLPRTCLVGHASSFPPWARGEQWLSR